MTTTTSTRRHPRVEAEHPMFLEPVEAASRGQFGRTRTIGPGGCLVETRERIGGPRARVFISVGGRIVTAEGRVVYERPHEDRYRIGMEFVELSEPDRGHLGRMAAEG